MVTGLFFAFLLIYFKMAKKWNIVDVPNHRSQHSGVTLRGGGIVYPFAFLCFLLVWVLRSSDVSQNFFVFGLGLLAVCSISFWDDIRNLSGKVRVLVHFFAVTLLLVFTGSFSILPLGMIPVVYILMIGILNAYNFMDGINGMTGLYSFVTLGSLLYVNEMIIHFTDTGFIVYPILATTVFLFFNFRKKAKCFMGDVGSIGIAFWVMTLLMLLILKSLELKWILFLMVYGIETVLTILERLKLKENIFDAHRRHLYQLLANEIKVDHRIISLFYAAVQIIINIILIIVTSQDTLAFISPVILGISVITYLVLKSRLKKYITS